MKTGHSDTLKFVLHCGFGCSRLKHGQDDRTTKRMSCFCRSLSLSHFSTNSVPFFPIQPSDTFRSLPFQSIHHHIFVFNLSVSLSLCVSHHSLFLFALKLLLPSQSPLSPLLCMYWSQCTGPISLDKMA